MAAYIHGFLTLASISATSAPPVLQNNCLSYGKGFLPLSLSYLFLTLVFLFFLYLTSYFQSYRKVLGVGNFRPNDLIRVYQSTLSLTVKQLASTGSEHDTFPYLSLLQMTRSLQGITSSSPSASSFTKSSNSFMSVFNTPQHMRLFIWMTSFL